MNSRYREIKAKTALNQVRNSRLPYQWDLNPYRGCAHHCCYCYALYSHQYLYPSRASQKTDQFFQEIFVKTNIAAKLEEKLSAKSWRPAIINIGSVCDSYQPAEQKYQLMPQILKILLKHENPVVISTKSRLILRDLELIKKLARRTYVNIATTITATDPQIQQKIEPFASTTSQRFEILQAFKETRANTGLHVMPILPFITDRRANLDQLFRKARKARVKYVLAGALNLRGPTRRYFFDFIAQNFPELAATYHRLYQNGRLNPVYKKRLHALIRQLKEKHRLSADYSKPIRQQLARSPQKRQQSLF